MFVINEASDSDFDSWATLYYAYADFYQVTIDQSLLCRTWNEIKQHRLGSLLIRSDTQIKGLAHFEIIQRPLRGERLCYLHDLFICPSSRNKGYAKALIEAVATKAREKGAASMRWATKPDNHRARALYVQLAQETDWVIYEKQL